MRKTAMLLIVLLVVSVGFLSGCDSLNTVSISEINDHPNSYLNKEVTIKAEYIFQKGGPGLPGAVVLIRDESDESMDAMIPPIDVDTSILFIGGWYYWKGIIIPQGSGVGLDVTEITPVD